MHTQNNQIAPYTTQRTGSFNKVQSMKRKGIKLKTSTHHHPATNRMAAQAYQPMPHSSMWMSPSELLLRRHPICRLDLLKHTTIDRVEANQWKESNNMMLDVLIIVLKKATTKCMLKTFS